MSPTPNEDSHTKRETFCSAADPTLAGAARVNRSSARIDMSLRTYRRRVAELLISLDAPSRFQAGVRAGESGLIRR